MDRDSAFPGILVVAAGLFVVYLFVHVLTVADNLLIPMVFAILIWYLLNSFDQSLSHITLWGWRPPRWLRLFFAVAALLFIFNMVTGIVAANVSSIVRAAPDYQENLEKLLYDLPFGLEIEDIPALSQLTELNIGILMQRLARESAGLLGNIGLISVYLIFLFLESYYFSEKLKVAAGSEQRQKWFSKLLTQIDRDIKRYLGVKTLLSLATAVAAWVIMTLVGLDFAGFWALLIFMLNFIPNLGSVAATILPSIIALLQFDTYPPFFIILFGLGAIQVTIGNILDPALMGKSLNVSPLVIIMSLVFWGGIWGLPGLFLCVPIMVILMIILYNIDKTRWIAIMLSKDGHIDDQS